MTTANDSTMKFPAKEMFEEVEKNSVEKKGIFNTITSKLAESKENLMSSMGVIGDPKQGVSVKKQLELSHLSNTWVDPHGGDPKGNDEFSSNELPEEKYKGDADITSTGKGIFPPGYSTEMPSKIKPVDDKQ